MRGPEAVAPALTSEALAPPGEDVPAPLLRRLASLVYEALLLAAVLLLATFLFLLVVRQATAGAARVALQAYLLVVSTAYFGWFWSDGRRTLAMRTWRIRLLGPSGGPPGPGRALARYAAAWIGPALALLAYGLVGKAGLVLAALNHAWALADPQRRFLHDRLAGTRLVRDSAHARRGRPAVDDRAGGPPAP